MRSNPKPDQRPNSNPKTISSRRKNQDDDDRNGGGRGGRSLKPQPVSLFGDGRSLRARRGGLRVRAAAARQLAPSIQLLKLLHAHTSAPLAPEPQSQPVPVPAPAPPVPSGGGLALRPAGGLLAAGPLPGGGRGRSSRRRRGNGPAPLPGRRAGRPRLRGPPPITRAARGGRRLRDAGGRLSSRGGLRAGALPAPAAATGRLDHGGQRQRELESQRPAAPTPAPASPARRPTSQSQPVERRLLARLQPSALESPVAKPPRDVDQQRHQSTATSLRWRRGDQEHEGRLQDASRFDQHGDCAAARPAATSRLDETAIIPTPADGAGARLCAKIELLLQR